MNEYFYAISNKIILCPSWVPCTSLEEMLDSKIFKKVLNEFLNFIGKDGTICYNEMVKIFGVMPSTVENMISFFKEIVKSDMNRLKQYEKNFPDFLLMIEDFVWDIYNFWMKYEKYLIINDDDKMTILERMEVIEKLILSLYRKIRGALFDVEISVLRQTNAGVSLGISVYTQTNFKTYKELTNIKMINSVIFQPPVFLNNKNSSIVTEFNEASENPLDNLKFNSDEWLVIPLEIFDKTAFVYFHIDYISNGLSICNIFKVMPKSKVVNKKPDLVLIYGAKDNKDETISSYYRDIKNDIIIGYINYTDDTDCFTYIKRMISILFGVSIIKNKDLPFRGMLLNLTFKNDRTYNILMIGDSNSGKFELSQVINAFLLKYIKDWKIVFNDIGFMRYANGKSKVYSVENGVFIKLSALSGKDNFYMGLRDIIARSVFITSDTVKSVNNNNEVVSNASGDVRIATLFNTTFDSIAGYEIDLCINILNIDTNYFGKVEYYKTFNDTYSVKEAFLRNKKVDGVVHGISKMFFIDEYNRVKEKRKIIEDLVERNFSIMNSNGNTKFVQIAINKNSNSSLVNVTKKIVDHINYE